MTQTTRRPAIPLRIRLYVYSVLGMALAVVAAAITAAGAVPRPVPVGQAVLLAVMIAVAQRNPVRVGLKRKINVSTAPSMAAVLLLPAPLAIAALLFGAIAGDLNGRLIQRIFNASAAVVRAGTGALAFAGIMRLGSHELMEPFGAIAAFVVIYISGTALVMGIAAVQILENPLRRSWAGQRDTIIAEVALGIAGMITALASVDHAWALPLLIAPAAIGHYALRDGVALRAQTQLALEELADIVDMRDHYTFEHSRRVAELARATARTLGLSHSEVDLITMAGRVHDVGKIGVKSSVLMKPQKLTDKEWREMRSHPEVGARLISNFPQFARGRDYVLHHHERFDGKGYPKALAGSAIPLGARVLAVADAWDAMTSHRAYRKALDMQFVYAELENSRGKQFDPVVLDAFLQALRERPDLAVQHVSETQEVDVAPEPVLQPEAKAS